MDVEAQKVVEAHLLSSLGFGFKITNLGHLGGEFVEAKKGGSLRNPRAQLSLGEGRRFKKKKRKI